MTRKEMMFADRGLISVDPLHQRYLRSIQPLSEVELHHEYRRDHTHQIRREHDP